MKKWLIGAGLLIVVLAGLGLGYFEAMKRGWVRYNQYDNRSDGLLQPGDPAPDLTLERSDGEGPVRLSTLFRERPLVLVFGSYT